MYFSTKTVMPATLAQKLRIKEGFSLRTLGAPAGFKDHLGQLPDDVSISAKTRNYDQLHWFVRNRAQLEEEIGEVLALLKDEVVCWIYYPKGSSKVQTDLTRDHGWEPLLSQDGLQWLSLISFDDTWSAFGMRRKNEKDRRKEEKPKAPRAIFDYIDAKAKIIYLPDDLAAALKKAPAQKTFFDGLSFTNKKEYVEWIVSAKREETRATRVKETIERLKQNWKNPANR